MRTGQQGVADGLDPSVAALATFGFSDILSNVTFVKSVPDAQMFAANAKWYGALSSGQRKAFDDERNTKRKGEELSYAIKKNVEDQARKSEAIAQQETLVNSLREKLSTIR